MVGFDDVLLAMERIRDHVYVTPLEVSPHLSVGRTRVFLKLENQQKLKGFKVRGALNKLLSLTDAEKSRGVMAVSSGNHGAGVSYAASLLGGIKAKIVVPATVPESKLEKIRYYGADVVAVGKNYDDAHAAAMEVLKSERLTFIDPCSDVEVIAAQGTIAMEIMSQNPEIDIIVAPIGGGGLITGLAVAAKNVKPSVRIVGVQTRACPAMVQSLKDGRCYTEFPSAPSICDALIGGVGEIPYRMAAKCIDEIILVEEESVKTALALLMIKEKVVAEPAGAVGVAAVMENPAAFEGKNVAVVVSGGNLDAGLMREVLNAEVGR